MAELNEKGQEVLDNTPVVLDVSPRPLPLVDRIKKAVRHELSENARNSGFESFEEANDFDIEDEFAEMDHISGYEVEEMIEEFPVEKRDEANKAKEDIPVEKQAGAPSSKKGAEPAQAADPKVGSENPPGKFVKLEEATGMTIAELKEALKLA